MSNTMVIVDLDIKGSEVFNSSITSYATGMWQFTWNPDTIRANSDFWKDSNGKNPTDGRTDSIRPGQLGAGSGVSWYSEVIAEVRSLSEVVSGSSTYYYDRPNNRVIFSSTGTTFTSDLQVPITVRFVDYAQKDPDNSYANTLAKIDGELCGVRVVPDTVSFNQTADDLGTARLTFDDCTFSLYNTDGAFDGYEDMMVGQRASVYYAEKEENEPIDTLKDFEYVFVGLTEDVTASGTVINIGCVDPRSDWTPLIHGKSPADTDINLLADISDKPWCPIVMGEAYRTPLGEVDRLAPGNPSYIPCDGAYIGDPSTDMVVKEKADDGSVSTWVYGSSNDYVYDSIYEIYVLKRAPTGDLFIEGTASITSPITGTTGDTCLDYIIWAMEKFYELPYNSANYDTNSIENYANNSSIGYYIGFDGLPLDEFLEHMLITSGNRMFLKPGKDANGWPVMRVTLQPIRFSDTVTPYPWDIPQLDWREATILPGSWEYKGDEYATSEVVGNRYDFVDDKPGRYQGFGFAKSALNIPVNKPREIENTYYTDRASSLSYSYTLDFYRRRNPYFLEVQFNSPLTPTLYDQVYFEHRRNDGTKIMNNALWRVEAVDKINHTLRLALLEIEDDPTPGETAFDGTMFGSGRMYLDDITGDITEVTP